jgi:hypothetical protein
LSVLELDGRFTSKVAKVIWLDLGLWEFMLFFFGPTTGLDNFADEQNTDRRLRIQQLQSRHNIMPKSLEKTRKKIAKKKGNITALHENSRDSQRLRRAQMRDDKLVKVASLRRKNDQPLSE